MSDIYTQTLARAAEAQGSTQALASLPHVPESTLLRWMSGRALMPVQAFLELIRAAAGGEKLSLRMGKLVAHCARCDGSEFLPADPARPVTLTSELQCAACGERVIHGNLIAQLAQDAVNQSRAYTAARAEVIAKLRDQSQEKR